MHPTIGLVLQVIPFQDNHQIATLFSPEWGVIKVIFKYARKGKDALPIEPLNIIEVILKKGRSDLFQSQNASLIDSQPKLRTRFETLNAALGMLASLLKSQMAQKPSPILFSLLMHYLKSLPTAPSPQTIAASFKLKILRHDGLLEVQQCCSVCGSSLKEGGIDAGEFYCLDHLPFNTHTFSEEELGLLTALSSSRSLIHLNQLALSPILEEKIGRLFEGLV